MGLVRDPDTGLFLKVCPHCGEASPSLGSRCPSCDQLYEPGRGVVDDLPLIDLDDWSGAGGPGAGLIVVVVGLINGAIVLLLGPPLALYRLLRRRITPTHGHQTGG